MNWGIWSLLPLLVTLVLAFVTRSALIAMLVGTFSGTLMLGAVPFTGLNELFQNSLGNGDFIWICEIVILIGILFEQFKRAGVLAALADRLSGTGSGRRRVQLSAWGMGFLIVDDYFSPLLTGAIIRPMSDRVLVSREKLAFILDATTASVCILVPFTAWGAYVASLIAAQGIAVASAEQGLAVFIGAIKYNFYPLLMLIFTLLICAGVIPDFGPMRTAENRAKTTGALLRPGAKPLVSNDDVEPTAHGRHASIAMELVVPVVLLIGFGAGTLIVTGSVKIVEAFMLANTWLFLVLALRGRLSSVADLADLIITGTKGVMPALLIIALAYALNSVTTLLGAGQFMIEQFTLYLDVNYLIIIVFIVTASISFSTGTSWGAYAMMMPVALPVAFEFSDGAIGPLVYQTVAAIAGGGIFGDHASPVSDTTVLSSVGAGSDHIDHVITQLPYALVVAGITAVMYLLI